MDARIAALTSAGQPLWGHMSVGGMVCHCADAFEVALGERTATASYQFQFEPAVLKQLSLTSPSNWPHGVPTSPEIKQGAGGTPPGQFEDDIGRLLTVLHRFVDHPGPHPEHPYFGPMTADEWLRWGFLHIDHHLRQFGR
jgi:hypothetical protein